MNKIELIQGDITQLEVDAIVNAANTSLLGGGGVDGAIHRAGGSAILDECRQIRARQGGCAVGEAVITTAGNMPARWVIHTVGPVWNGGNSNEEQLLRNAYTNSLKLALEYGVQSIAFPNISTGVYRFPKEKAAEISLKAIRDFQQQEPDCPQRIIIVCFDAENNGIYQSIQGSYK